MRYSVRSIFQKKNIPNILSVFRIFLVPLFAALFLTDYPKYITHAGVVFVLAGATDVVDGFLARKNGWITDVGKLIDPLADKLMSMTALACLAIKEKIYSMIVIIVIIKEIVMILGSALILKKRKIYVKSNAFGKAATFSLFLLVIMTMFFTSTPQRIIDIFSGIVIGLMLLAFTIYLTDFIKEDRLRAKICKK
ncbi:CDP-diacylglycerol--glycerol-3-phosphate 3-phosphatidyltransferase [bioreactor metagenome]|uniref:CDP-diacylglycerol--glycerol-3-phosphate 3-phosphatidyltransferase n=1 Tax=bioreactor metagenome TaxID=1076179 RepID=A0A644YZ34_9ZZZZ|nr:CDP-alcohol phosphatidyltransferase family protein [Oscillospiraceae bacterium]